MMMKKRIIRHNFNMVEIMLAVIVIALGLTSTFVLFPVGLNASKDAVAENRVSDVGESTLAIIQSYIMPDIVTASGDGFFGLSTPESDYFCNPDAANVKTLIDGPVDLNTLNASNRYEGRNDMHKLANGVFVHVQKIQSNNEITFAAAIKVYLDRNSDSGFEDEYFYSRNGTFQKYSDLKSTTGDCINKFLLPVTIEVSWPATLPIGEREKRIFRFEMFNHEYNPGNDDDAKPAGA